MEEYEKLLDKAYEELPEIITKTERFQVEKVKGHIEGNKTVIINFLKIAKNLNRKPEHLLKYLLREIATPGKLAGDRLILGAKIPAASLNKKIKQYINEFVICPDCNSPDTKLTKDKDVSKINCMACGSKRFVKTI